MAKSVVDIVAEAAGSVTERVSHAAERLEVCVPRREKPFIAWGVWWPTPDPVTARSQAEQRQLHAVRRREAAGAAPPQGGGRQCVCRRLGRAQGAGHAAGAGATRAAAALRRQGATAMKQLRIVPVG
jgi:hypothetical protein